MTSTWFDDDLSISVDVPDGWEVGETDDVPLVLLAPEEDGYRANVTFAERANDPPTKDGFVAAIEQLKAEQARDFAGYEQLGERRIEQDGRPGFLLRSQWDHEHGPTRLTQVAALYAEAEDRIIVVHASALASREQDYVAQFREILDSLRFGGPSTG